MWINDDNASLHYSDEELKNKILTALPDHKLIILDGPTMCGKTNFLKSLPADLTTISGFYHLLENYVDLLRTFFNNHDAFNSHKRELIKTYRAQRQIICFEDIDMSLAGKSASQEEFAFLFIEMTETNTVILTGIDIDRRCPALISKYGIYKLDYYRWMEV